MAADADVEVDDEPEAALGGGGEGGHRGLSMRRIGSDIWIADRAPAQGPDSDPISVSL